MPRRYLKVEFEVDAYLVGSQSLCTTLGFSVLDAEKHTLRRDSRLCPLAGVLTLQSTHRYEEVDRIAG